MFSPADAHIVVCDAQRLPGPKATMRMADCASVVVRALNEGDHYALLPQACLGDDAKPAKLGVWPKAALPLFDLELQLAVPTTAYHWLQAFPDLRWRGKAERQIGPTHWTEWLHADEHWAAVCNLGPAPAAARAPDLSARGRSLAPHTVTPANLPFALALKCSIRKSVALPPTGGAIEPSKSPMCADKLYTSGAMLEHLPWHAVHATAPLV